jgi:dTDP-4-dehydrorhamnose reductase
MKILITGASSLPGYRTTQEALNKGHEVIAIYNTHPIPIENDKLTKIKLDIRDYLRVQELLEREKPEVIIHMAALGNVDQCEKEKKLAWEVNVQATINIARFASKTSSFIVYLSTDYVFDGEKGNYAEDTPPNPVDYYGLTKLMGEIACMSANTDYAIVRASSIYGFGPGRSNFAKFLVEKLSKGEPIKALVDQYTTPTQASLLAKAVMEIIERGLKGVFHTVGKKMNRYEFALEVAEVIGLDKSLIKQARMDEMSWYAKRPKDSSLNCNFTRKLITIDFHTNYSTFKMLKQEFEELR